MSGIISYVRLELKLNYSKAKEKEKLGMERNLESIMVHL